MSSSKCPTCEKQCWSFEWSGCENDLPVCEECYTNESHKNNGLSKKKKQELETICDTTKKTIPPPTSASLDEKKTKIREWLTLSDLEAKPHQFDGWDWLLKREKKTIEREDGFGGIPGGLIADEMGLGKTILMIGLMVANMMRRTLIVVPPALLSQWATEIKKTTGHKVLIFHGHYKSSVTIETLISTPIVLTTYGHIKLGKKDIKTSLLHMVPWNRIIFDEAHHLRNQQKNFRGAMLLQRKYVWMLTGTPIQNRINDLNAYWKMLNLTVDLTNIDNTTFQNLKKKYILRRTKASINLELPAVHRETIKVKWETDEERDFAEEIHASLPFSNVKTNPREMVAEMTRWMITAMVRSRQVCTKTSLMMKVMRELQQEIIYDEETDRETDYETDSEDIPRSEMPCVLNQSKINAVVKKILERRENGRKKLVFSHYRGEIDEIKRMLTEQGMNVEYFDGRVSPTQRKRILKQNTSDVLILQIKTACEGLNLQDFKEVYFVTPHWNPAVEDQAIARCHRIGQTEEVNVFRFEMENFGLLTQSIDTYCTQVQNKKRELQEFIE